MFFVLFLNVMRLLYVFLFFPAVQLKECLLLPLLLTVLALPLQTEPAFLGGVLVEALSMVSSYGSGVMPLIMDHLLHHHMKLVHLHMLEEGHQLA